MRNLVGGSEVPGEGVGLTSPVPAEGRSYPGCSAGPLPSQGPLKASVPLAGGDCGHEHERGHMGGSRRPGAEGWGLRAAAGPLEPPRWNAVLPLVQV